MWRSNSRQGGTTRSRQLAECVVARRPPRLPPLSRANRAYGSTGKIVIGRVARSLELFKVFDAHTMIPSTHPSSRCTPATSVLFTICSKRGSAVCDALMSCGVWWET